MASSVMNVARGAGLPIVVILGATGSGKSKLAISIAKKFNGEIISADSMQVYRGLDIITNKVTSEEQKLAPHHLLNFLDPLSRYTVVDYRDTAIPIIERLLSKGILPVIVGGTNYYIESVLWNVLVDDLPKKEVEDRMLLYERDKEYYQAESEDSENIEYEGNLIPRTEKCDSENVKYKGNLIPDNEKCDGENLKFKGNLILEKESDAENLIPESKKCDVNKREGDDSDNLNEVPQKKKKCDSSDEKVLENNNSFDNVQAWQDCNQSTQDLYKRLLEVDPDSALQYHPNNRRKIIRSLQVWERTGRRHSDVLKEQQQEVGGSKLGGGLRFKNTIILWITCKQEVLDNRLDERVDDMLDRGLLQELTEFHSAYNVARLKEGKEADYTKGIFQSIGFKEFHDYLILPKEERESGKGKAHYEAGIEDLKQVTRRYSRKQVRWIRNRFILPSKRQKPPLYTVDGTNVDLWNENVNIPALEIVSSLIDGKQPSQEPVKNNRSCEVADIDMNDKTRFECDVCGRVLIGQFQWRSHLKGAKHRKMLKRKHQGKPLVSSV